MTLQDLSFVLRGLFRRAETPALWRVTFDGKPEPDALRRLRAVGTQVTLELMHEGSLKRIRLNLLEPGRGITVNDVNVPQATFRLTLRSQRFRPVVLALELRGLGWTGADRIRLEFPS